MEISRRKFVRNSALAGVGLATLGGSKFALASTSKDEIVVSVPGGIQSMDPHLAGGLSMRIWTNVYEGLLSSEADGTLKPRLAESWEQVDDTHYRFKIREGVNFSTGNPADAVAIAECLNVKNDKSAPHIHAAFTSWLTKATAEDEHTLLIETDGPFPLIYRYLATSLCGAIYDPAARAAQGDLGQVSAGTGAWVLDEIRAGQFVRLKRNENYWGDKAQSQFLTFRVVPEELTRVLAVKRGDADIVLDFGVDSLDELQSDENLDVTVGRILRITTCEFNFLDPLIRDNKEVREAAMLAIDTAGIAENVLRAGATTADSVVLDSSWGYKSVPGFVEQDLDAANALLEGAGWVRGSDGVRAKDGVPLRVKIVVDVTRDAKHTEVIQLLKAYLDQVGFGADLLLLERGPFTEMVTQKGEGYHLALKGWGVPTNDASWAIYPRFHSANQGLGSYGTTRNRMPALDELIDAARFESDEAKAEELWGTVQDAIYEEKINIPIYYHNGITVTRKTVDGFVNHPDEWYGYRYQNVSFS